MAGISEVLKLEQCANVAISGPFRQVGGKINVNVSTHDSRLRYSR